MSIDRERFIRDTKRMMDVCPGCKTEVGPATCHMYYSTWDCWGCGAKIDGRVATPELVLRCENEWPDYDRHFGDPAHPIACSCSGRGWYALDETNSR